MSIDELAGKKTLSAISEISFIGSLVLRRELWRVVEHISILVSELEEFRAAIVAYRDKELEGGAE